MYAALLPKPFFRLSSAIVCRFALRIGKRQTSKPRDDKDAKGREGCARADSSAVFEGIYAYID